MKPQSASFWPVAPLQSRLVVVFLKEEISISADTHGFSMDIVMGKENAVYRVHQYFFLVTRKLKCLRPFASKLVYDRAHNVVV